ncbi:GrpB family protein [Oceanobacillus timonensis]|uniref:GrpB family protein n=1 Tax=Oceanobacillus timonensis TaxID=1926285 RepID=UPI0009BB6AF4|nr:GrpB family protein [Oceanobacillus timonensis]
MKEIVTFAPEEKYRDKAEKVFQKHRNLIKNCLPEVEVYHVGSTAIKGSLTKGDVDLQVRVSQGNFNKTKEILMKLYDINEESDQTSFFCAFEKKDEILPLGVQLTVIGSSVDNFRKLTQFFIENPTFIESYNQLKRKFEGKDMKLYRDEKAIFIAKLLSSDGYKIISNRIDLYEAENI